MSADDLAPFLADRYDEREAVANAATPGPWRVDSETFAEEIIAADGTYVIAGGRWGGEASVFNETEDAIHIALHDPAAALRDLALKRAILAEHKHVKAQATDPGGPDFGCGTCHYAPDYGIFGDGWCVTVRQLGTEFASHSAYKESWKP